MPVSLADGSEWFSFGLQADDDLQVREMTERKFPLHSLSIPL
jgi:hypothetical protein